MKKLLYITISLLLCTLSACSDDDNEWGNLGENPVEGLWMRLDGKDADKTVIARFNADHISSILTYNEEGELEYEALQGTYRVQDNRLIYQAGFVNLYELLEDGNLMITYGYDTPAVKTYLYAPIENLPGEEPEETPDEGTEETLDGGADEADGEA